MKDEWQVQVHGGAGENSFEISVINKPKIRDAQRFYGWFDENKLLITHNGGPCKWPLIKQVWDKQIALAKEVTAELNKTLK